MKMVRKIIDRVASVSYIIYIEYFMQKVEVSNLRSVVSPITSVFWTWPNFVIYFIFSIH